MSIISTVNDYLQGALQAENGNASGIDERLVARHEGGMDYLEERAVERADIPEDVPARFQEDLVDAAVLPGGLSNDLWETQDGDVVKRIAEKPGTRYSVALGNMLADGFDIPTYEDRRRNEVGTDEEPGIADVFGRTWMNTADLRDDAGQYKKEEKVPGNPLHDADLDPEQVYRVAYKFGSSLRRFHNEDYALTDARLSNLLVDPEQADTADKPAYLPQDPLQSWVDFEYAKTDASDREQEMDHITVISSARQLSPDRYAAFREGYEDGYGEEVPDAVDLQANLTSRIHAGLQEPDLERYQHQQANQAADLSYSLTDLVRDKAGIILGRQRTRAREQAEAVREEYGF